MTTTATPFDWSAVAAEWDAERDHVSRTSSRVVDVLLERLAPRPGERLLELGAGTGDLARELAARVLPGGRVVATDAAQGMVDLITSTVADLPNVSAGVADAADIPLPHDSFDGVVFQMGLMFVLDPAAAAREIRRVLVPEGRAVIATWAAPEHNPWLTCVGMAAMAEGVVSGGPPTAPGGLFSLATPEALRGALETGGLRDVVVEEAAVEVRFTSPEDYAEHVSRLAGPLAVAIAAAPDGGATVRARAAELVSPWASKDGVVVPGLALVAAARA